MKLDCENRPKKMIVSYSALHISKSRDASTFSILVQNGIKQGFRGTQVHCVLDGNAGKGYHSFFDHKVGTCVHKDELRADGEFGPSSF